MKPQTGYFCVCDPDGALVHTTVATKPEESIALWLEIESSMNFLSNIGRTSRGESKSCLPSWEGFEAEGYTVIPVSLTAEVPLA